jgi:hypothetical protein
MKKNGFAPVIVILIIAAVGVVGYLLLKNTRLTNNNQSQNQQNSNNQTCGDYDQFLKTVQNLVAGSVDTTNNNPNYVGYNDFLWTRKAGEAMVNYPIIKQFTIGQDNKNANGDSSAEKVADSVSSILSQNLD